MPNCIDPNGKACMYATYFDFGAVQHTPTDKGIKRELACGHFDPPRTVIKNAFKYSGSPAWCPLKFGKDDRPIVDSQLHCKINDCKSSNGERLCCWFCGDRESCDDKCHNRPSACGLSFMMGGTTDGT